MSADTLVGNYRELNLVLSAPAHIGGDQNGSKKDEAMPSASPAADPGFTNPTATLHDAECDDTVLQPLQRVPSAATSTSSDSSGGSIPINSLLPQVLAAVSVSLGSMIVGFSSGYTSPALVKMQEDNSTITITPEQASWIGSVMPLAALVGGILGGPLIEHVGRRTTILGTALPFTLSFLLIALAWDVGLVLGGRALGGFCVGIASLAFPVYLGETIQPEVRGTLGLLPTAIGNIGILLCFVSGKYLGWSELAIMGACLPIPFLICMLLIPETPRYLISKDRQKAARKALQWLRGSNADVTTEYNEIERSHTTAQKEAPRFAELFTQGNLKPLLISVGLMFFQQFSGINAVIFYTVSIFRMAGSTIEDNLATIIVGIVNFLATFVATVLIDRLGRKVLLYISGCTMIVTLAVLGTFFYLKDVEQHDMTSVGWLPLACFVLYVVGFSLGFGPIPWLMMGEILPARVRGTAASVATAFNWTCTFLVTKTFLDLIRVAGTHGAFWIFGAICIVAMFFVRICVPETQGRSLEDIEKSLTGRRVRRMSSVANLKPMPLGV